MTDEDVRYEVSDHVATITFNRPEQLNAFRVETMRDFIAALDRIDADDDVHAAIVTGEGRAFCAGADLSAGAAAFEPMETKKSDKPARDGGGILALRIMASKKPIIGAINGASVGMGATMTLPMDVRLASTKARFGFVFTRRGIIPEGCSSWFLPRVVGIGTANEWMLTGRLVDASEAHAAHLVRSVHEPDELLPAAMAIAREISDNTAPVSVALTRTLMWKMLTADSPEVAHEAETNGLAVRSRSGDAREGVSSFLEKRSANFPDRVSDADFSVFD